MKDVSPLSLVDLLTIPGVDREILTFLHLRQVARLASTCKALQSGPLDWMLDRELLLQLKCPEALRNQILDALDSTRHSKTVQVQASSRRVVQPAVAHSIWDALKPILVNAPLKQCYGLRLTILHSSAGGVDTPPPIEFELRFSNEVFCHIKDITIFETGYYSCTNYEEQPGDLECLCVSNDCCFGAEQQQCKYYYVKGLYRVGDYYCKACLEHNCFVKLRKIRQHPGSYVVWNGTRTKL